jgi:hypothetical protein
MERREESAESSGLHEALKERRGVSGRQWSRDGAPANSYPEVSGTLICSTEWVAGSEHRLFNPREDAWNEHFAWWPVLRSTVCVPEQSVSLHQPDCLILVQK